VAPSNLTLKPYKKDVSNDKYELLLHSCAHPRLDYTATEESSGSADSHLKHYVAVYDPATHELHIVEAHRVVLRSSLRPTQEELEEVQTQSARPTLGSLRRSLGMEFGTKKAKKAIAALTDNAISPRKSETSARPDSQSKDALVTAVLESMASSTAGMPTRDDIQAAVDEAKPRPKPNMDATTPAEVYPLDSLISREERVAMQVTDWLYAVENKEAVKTSSRFVANRLQNIASSKDISRLKALRYILAIIDFNAVLKPLRGGGRKLPLRDELKKKVNIPDAVLDGMKRKFAAGSELTKWHVDKLMTHTAALALFVDNFETDVYDLREDLRLDSKQIHQYYRELGCKISGPTEKERERLKISKAEAIQHHIAKLKIPPEFPKQRNLPVKRR